MHTGEEHQMHIKKQHQMHTGEEHQMHIKKQHQMHTGEEHQMHIKKQHQMHTGEEHQMHIKEEYQMFTKKAKSFNHQVFEKAYKRLKLSPTERIVFQRLLGFLIRNDKPFPYSAPKMAEITGFCLRTIFNVLNQLEKYRLIIRTGLGKNRKFKQGTILRKIFTTVQNRQKPMLSKERTTVQPTTQKSNNRAMGAYSKTYSFLKRNKVDFTKPSKPHFHASQPVFDPEYHEYVKRRETDMMLGLIPRAEIHQRAM